MTAFITGKHPCPFYKAITRLYMANMNHCRFPNTLGDLQDIQESLSNDEGISPEQESSALDLLELCAEIAGQFTAHDIARLVAKYEKEND